MSKQQKYSKKGWTTKKTLIAKLRDNDEIGWEEFYTTYKSLIYSVIIKHGIDSHTAIEDIFHNIMLAVFNKGKFSFQPSRGVKFRTWLRRIIKNKINDYYRKKYKRKTCTMKTAIAENEAVNSMSDIFDAEWKYFIAKECMTQLKHEVSAEMYKIFELYVLHKKRPEEISQIVGIDIQNIYVYKSRCAKKLRDIYISFSNSKKI